MTIPKLSRREFSRLAGGVCAGGGLAPAQTAPLTASQIVERIKQRLGVKWGPNTVDTFKIGDPEAPVRGVATTFMATLDVLQRSAAAGANFVISHEPTFWNHLDKTEDLRDDPVFQHKRAFIEKNRMVVFRLHDGLHACKPDMIYLGWDKLLGWEKYLVSGPHHQFDLPPTTVEAIARHFASRLMTSSIRLVGDPKLKVSRLALAGHNVLDKQCMMPDCDVVVLFEAWERNSAEFVRDLALSGGKRALILTAHESGEEAGMDEFAQWLRPLVPEVPVKFIPAGDAFWIPKINN
jgi:putative NIF3 family GTP cyclohydrolase 1 type 2